MLTLGFLLIIIKQESFSPIPLKLRTKCNLTDSYLCSCFALSLLLVLLKSLSKVSATSKCFYTYHWWLFIIPAKYPGALLLSSQGKYRVTNKKKKKKNTRKLINSCWLPVCLDFLSLCIYQRTGCTSAKGEMYCGQSKCEQVGLGQGICNSSSQDEANILPVVCLGMCHCGTASSIWPSKEV